MLGSLASHTIATCYLLLCGVCVLLWIVLPTVCFAVFLGMSMWHFGQSDQSHSGYTVQHILRVVTDGGIWVLLLPFSHQSVVHELFIVLGADGSIIMQIINWLIIPWSLLALVTVVVRILNGDGKAVISTLSFAALSIMMPPLWSLCIYFCAWHSRRHISRILSDLSSPRLGWIMMISLTSITVLTGAAGGALVTGDHAVDCCGGTGFFYWLVRANSASYVVN